MILELKTIKLTGHCAPMVWQVILVPNPLNDCWHEQLCWDVVDDVPPALCVCKEVSAVAHYR